MYLKQFMGYQKLTQAQATQLTSVNRDAVDEARAWARVAVSPYASRYLLAPILDSPAELPDNEAEVQALADATAMSTRDARKMVALFGAGLAVYILDNLYVTSGGEPVPFPNKAVARLVANAHSAQQVDLAQLREATITLTEWELRQRRLIRNTYIAAALLAGGASAYALETSARALALKYNLVSDMVLEIAVGKQRLPGVFRRARRYISFGFSVYEAAKGRGLDEAGFTEYRNILGVAEHCAQCVEVAEVGWAAIGSLPPIGSRLCGDECKCSWEYRRGDFTIR